MVDDIIYVYRQQRRLAEAAIEQVDDDGFFEDDATESNSIAIIMKHVGGNLQSRWSDFLTSDGEKPDRNRDGEFAASGQSRAQVLEGWARGWTTLESALAQLGAADLQRTVTIRGEPCTVLQALLRNLAHSSHHCGQIVLLAKSRAGERWKSLSSPRDKSQAATANFWK